MRDINSAPRRNLSESIADDVRTMIVDGELADGDRVNEVGLAEELGVSRTPLREALMRLTAEGALIIEPNRGFYVAPLSVEELEQLYPMRAILDPAALRMAGSPTRKVLDELDAINARLVRTRDPMRILKLDDEWHLLLLAHCPNRIIINLIEQFIWRTRRYEIGLMRDRKNVMVSTGHHAAVTRALRRGNLDGACAALRLNMQGGVEPIIAWLKERDHQPSLRRKRLRKEA